MTICYVLFIPVKVYQFNITVNGVHDWLRSGSYRAVFEEVTSDFHIFTYDMRYNRICALIENDFKLCDQLDTELVYC